MVAGHIMQPAPSAAGSYVVYLELWRDPPGDTHEANIHVGMGLVSVLSNFNLL